MDAKCQSLLETLFLHHKSPKEDLQKICLGLRGVLPKIRKARRRAQKEGEEVAGVITDFFTSREAARS